MNNLDWDDQQVLAWAIIGVMVISALAFLTHTWWDPVWIEIGGWLGITDVTSFIDGTGGGYEYNR